MPPEPAPFIIPIFLPHLGCPHRCCFCNQKKIAGTASRLPSQDAVHQTIETCLGFPKHRPAVTQIAFYGGNFLGLAQPDRVSLLQAAEEWVQKGLVDGIRFSTRPDTIHTQTLEEILPYTVTTIELGVQSMDDPVLALSDRGHTSQDTIAAVKRIRRYPIRLGIQMMLGLPGDTEQTVQDTAHRIADLSPDFVRIYPTLVLAGSPLAKMWEKGAYTSMALQPCVQLTARIVRIFRRQDIPVIRIGLQASPELNNPETVLAGPYHPAFGHLVYSELFWEKMVEMLTDGEADLSGRDLTVLVHSRRISTVRGIRNRNIDRLVRRFGFQSVQVKADDSQGKEGLQTRIN